MSPIDNTNNSNSIPDSLTSFDNEDINSGDLAGLESEAAMAGISAGLDPTDNSSADWVTVGSPSNSDSDNYAIGVSSWNSSNSNPYDLTGSTDFYNLGVTDTTPDTTAAKDQILQQRQQELNNFKRYMNGITDRLI